MLDEELNMQLTPSLTISIFQDGIQQPHLITLLNSFKVLYIYLPNPRYTYPTLDIPTQP